MLNSKKHPYKDLPDYQFWKKEPGISNPALFDPINEAPFKINQNDQIVTAGSCFAQHVARHLSKAGFNHLITENAHPLFDEEIAQSHNYGTFSARYGNVYTARQLKQLLLRAFGQFQPIQSSWETNNGSVVDPFRPQIQPNGFVSTDELEVDREQHLKCVKKAFEKMSVFVFTLGLTECWLDPRDGAVFPIAPGIAGGVYDEETVEFRNFTVEETVEDLQFSLNFIREINPDVKFILTVSPVPLNATYENKHVWLSTTYSKSVLRIAAEIISQSMSSTFYFPSYEIVTSPYARGQYFADDCRSVTQRGVDSVMHVFLKHFSKASIVESIKKTDQPKEDVSQHFAIIESALEALCDEEAISNG